MTDIGEAAQWYAEKLGWHVVPVHSIVGGRCTCGKIDCGSPGKHPRTVHGIKDATADLEQISRWWTTWPDSNIGLATGKPSNVDALDVDPRACGDESLYELERTNGEVPETVLSLTGGGGSHLFFQHIPDTRNSASDIGSGLDWKTTGGYVVLPPSVHVSGRLYTWEGSSRPNEVPIAPCPLWLIAQLQKQAGANGNGHCAPVIEEKIPKGKQHERLVSFAGSMRRRGGEFPEIFAALKVMNENRCTEPGPIENIRKIAQSFSRYMPAEAYRAAKELASASLSLPALITATELYQGQTIKLRALVEGMLYDGLTMLVAKPKAGKSWLTLQAGVHIAGGRKVEGISALDTGPVLYGAFEEPASRTMARLRQIAPPGPWTANLHFLYELMPLMGGGAEQLAGLIEKVRPRLVVLDTLTALIKGGGKRESDVFRSQYAEVSRVRKLAEDFKTAVLLVHHTRKGISDGAIEAVAGTGGIAAAVDTVWQLKRKPEGEATLDVVGREVEERTLAMRFEEEPFGWRVLGDDAGLLLNAERRQILEVLKEDGALTPAQIAAELSKSRPAVRQLLKRMRDYNQVQKQGLKYTAISLSMSHRVTERESL